jgi:hypothetical protein
MGMVVGGCEVDVVDGDAAYVVVVDEVDGVVVVLDPGPGDSNS